MKKIKYVMCVLFIALLAPRLTWADDSHSHHTSTHRSGESGQTNLQLNNGKKWETDQALREGMNRIRLLMEADIEAIHRNKLSNAAYSALSQKITVELDKIFKNCKLKPEADAVLHSILAQIIGGTTQMKSDKKKSARRDGAIKIINVFGQYGKVFDHPGWGPVQH